MTITIMKMQWKISFLTALPARPLKQKSNKPTYGGNKMKRRTQAQKNDAVSSISVWVIGHCC